MWIGLFITITITPMQQLSSVTQNEPEYQLLLFSTKPTHTMQSQEKAGFEGCLEISAQTGCGGKVELEEDTKFDRDTDSCHGRFVCAQ